MGKTETSAKGIILSSFPQGEYGKRLSILTDRYGKITVFAVGAAKQTSKIIGSCRPFTCAQFTLMEGRGAWNLHGVSVFESFAEIPLSENTAFPGAYFLELCDYFAREGMPQEDARRMLNLLYVALRALLRYPEKNGLIRRIYELKMLVFEGIYTEKPAVRGEAAEKAWEQICRSALTPLFDKEFLEMCFPEEKTEKEFSESVEILMRQEVPHTFLSAQLLL